MLSMLNLEIENVKDPNIGNVRFKSFKKDFRRGKVWLVLLNLKLLKS